ncbi:MAG: hypothetical protein Q8867_06165 [Bacteroidota bacterium]|nr:hypothetical protein [Bacteroidota bacterium]
MNKNAKYIITIIVIILGFNISCKKEKSYTYYISQELKTYAVFQPGSYWVYKNELTGVLDSSYINIPPGYTYTHLGEHLSDPIWESCNTLYCGNFIYSSYVDQDKYAIDFYSWGSTCLMSNKFKPGFLYEIQSNMYFKDVDEIDSLVINNNKYYHVLNTQYLSKSIFDGDSIIYSYYLVKSLGLIKISKKVHNIDTSWSLLRYHVVQ